MTQQTASVRRPGHRQNGGAYAWLVWALAALSFGYAFFHRVAPSVMVSDLMAEFAIGGAMLGTLSALYFYPYVLLQIPLGALLKLWARDCYCLVRWLWRRRGRFIWFGPQIELAYLGRILIGIGSSVGFLGSLALARRWFPERRFAFLAGLSMFTAMTSGMVAQAPLAWFVDEFGWRSSILLLAAVGFGLAGLVFMLVRNAPAGQVEQASAGFDRVAFSASLRQAAANREVWKIAFVALTLSGPMLTLGGLWGTPYLIAAYDLARPDAAFLMSLLLLGWAFGAPAAGWLSDRLGRRKPILVAGCAVVCTMLTVLIVISALPLAVVVGVMIVIGFAGGAMATCFALVREVIPERLAGAATGIVNSLTVASGAVLQPVVGLLLDMMAPAPASHSAAYRLAFWLFADGLAGSFVALRCVNGLNSFHFM